MRFDKKLCKSLAMNYKIDLKMLLLMQVIINGKDEKDVIRDFKLNINENEIKSLRHTFEQSYKFSTVMTGTRLDGFKVGLGGKGGGFIPFNTSYAEYVMNGGKLGLAIPDYASGTFNIYYGEDVSREIISLDCINCPIKHSCKYTACKMPIASKLKPNTKVAGFSWNKQQQEFLDSKKDVILVDAVAGAGKTTVLAEKVINMKDDLDNAYLLSFSNTAASEMESKINGPLAYSGDKQLNIKTYDKLAYELVSQNPAAYGYEEVPELLANPETEANNFKIQYGVIDDNYPFFKYQVEWNTYLKSKNYYIFNESNYIINRAIKNGLWQPEILIIDEFQDTSLDELNSIVTLLNNGVTKKLIALGDTTQGIYEFRGALSKPFKTFSDALDKSLSLDKICFNVSNRVTHDIADIANQVTLENSLNSRSARLEDFNEVVATKGGGEIAFAPNAVKQVEELSYHGQNDIAILTKGNAELVMLNKKIPGSFVNNVNTIGDTPLFNIVLGIVEAAIMNDLDRAEDLLKKLGVYKYLHDKDLVMYEIITALQKSKDTVSQILYFELQAYLNLSDAYYELTNNITYKAIAFNKNPNTVFLSTLFRSKGMEFKNVIITGADRYQLQNYIQRLLGMPAVTITLNKTIEKSKKEFFVAITRSEENVYLEVKNHEVEKYYIANGTYRIN